MSRRIRANARYAFYKSEMRNQPNRVGTRGWRKKNGLTTDQVARMRQKYRAEVLLSGDGSVVPTPVRSEGFTNHRTTTVVRHAKGHAVDMKTIGTKLKRSMLEFKALVLSNPTDLRAQALYANAQDEYQDHLRRMSRDRFAMTLPTTVPALTETFTKVV
jgi:hypothetical protein